MFRITRMAFMPAVWGFLVVACIGCGNQKVDLPPEDDVAESKVQAIKELADAMAKNADGMEAKAALENFRLIGLDPRKTPKQAAEIAEIYRTKILNKYKGSVAQELKGDIAPYLAATKPAK